MPRRRVPSTQAAHPLSDPNLRRFPVSVPYNATQFVVPLALLCNPDVPISHHTTPPLRCKHHQDSKLTLHQTSCNRIPLVLPLVPPQPWSLAFSIQRMDLPFFWGCLGVAHALFWGGPTYLNFSSFFGNHGFDKTVEDAINSMKKDPLPQWKISQYNGDPLQRHECFGQFKSATDSKVTD